jgi:hypothetical protein
MATLDLGEHHRLIPSELWVEELEVLVGGRDVCSLAEAVRIELADEGADVVVLEIGRQDVACERVGFTDDERVPLGCPLDAVLCALLRDDLVELREEGRVSRHQSTKIANVDGFSLGRQRNSRDN